MYAVERLSSYITRGVYTVSGPFHPFGGAVDVIVVQQQDGSFKSSPWNVRFGKFQGVLKTKEKIVNVCVNGTDATFHMYLDHKGEAYFLKDASQDEGESLMSPSSSGDETDGPTKDGGLGKTQSCDHGESCRESVGGRFDAENAKMVARTNPRRPRIFSFVFGRRTVKEGSNGGDLDRISSLERAEIAADLLEVKWSTNLPTNEQTGSNCLKIPSDGDGVGNAVDGEQRPAMQSSDVGLVHDNEITSPHEAVGGNIENKTAERLDEPACNGYPELRTFEEVIEIYSSETGELAHESEVVLSSPKAVEFDVSFKESVIVNPTIDLYSHKFHELSSDKDCHLVAGVSGDDTGEREVSSFFYCQTSESSNAMHDASACTAFEVLNSLSEGERHKMDLEHLNQTSQQPSEKYQRLEPRPFTVKENLDWYCNENVELNNHMDSLQTADTIAGACEKPVVACLSMESLSSHDLSLLTSEHIETGTVDVIQQDVLEEETAQENVMGVNMLEIAENLCEMDGGSAKPNYCTPGFNQQLSSSEEAKSQRSYVPLETFNTSDKIQEPCNPMERVKFDQNDFPIEDTITREFNSSLHMSEVANGAILLENMEEDQFLFDEIDNFISYKQPAQLATTGEIEEGCPSTVMEGCLGDHESADTSLEVHDADLSVVSKGQTSPISIPKLKRCPEEKEHQVVSLPNIRSHIYDLERSNIHPTSHSLHINSNTSMWGLQEKDICSSSNIESQSESHLLHPQPFSENESVLDMLLRREEQNGSSISPAVEISLCRHLLLEGMGTEAASKVFDAEKVDLEKFAELGASIVKNDKLVIRIDGHYFPWNAAAPIILGIASFGREGIFDAESMIAVDRTDKTLEEDQSRAIVPSGGAWRLWPFNFKKSRSMNSTHLAPNITGTLEKGTAAVSADTKMRSDNHVQKSRAMKRKVRSVTPTSEQLASLKLKEGQNLVTFSFSTAMLGRQQVDARIYLWKWNTRIVVSDVDGTITKSDVLGQFMPLVGKDWSQTGVAHLFSAIKENGYQLLFLSARAISQAYLTRQFLFNLKQDGKALPDGPVVISPDGLFPSLYREVIRRAPHEFKISCLEEIRDLFPPECNPFYAGFGNRDTDEISYLKVGIPKGKIFIINPKGEVAVNHRVDTKSYTSLHALVNAMFPATPSAEQEDFNAWNYWKLPVPDIDI